LLGIAAGCLFLLPRVAVDAPGPYDPSKPSPITFTISNVNIVPLRNLEIGIGLCYVLPPEGERGVELRGADAGSGRNPVECNGPVFAILTAPQWHLRWLDSDEKFEIALEEVLRREPNSPKQIEKANVVVSIKYEPWFVPLPEKWKPTRQFRFITRKLSDGKIYWTPTPLNR
jgi:hypothetical protein